MAFWFKAIESICYSMTNFKNIESRTYFLKNRLELFQLLLLDRRIQVVEVRDTFLMKDGSFWSLCKSCKS